MGPILMATKKCDSLTWRVQPMCGVEEKHELKELSKGELSRGD